MSLNHLDIIIKVGNFWYFFYIMIATAIIVGSIFFLKNKTVTFRYWFIFGITASALLMHFGKLLFEPYRSNLPYSVRKITFENICAVSTLIFPIIYLSKSQRFKDYMVYMGIISGLAALCYPTEGIDKSPFSYDTIRFYYAHIAIMWAPILMVVFNVHRPDYKKIYRLTGSFVFICGLIVVNEVLLMALGLVDGGLDELLSPSYRNNSLIFGITENMYGAAGAILWAVPKFLLRHPITKEAMCWPILWFIIPYFIYASITSFLISLTYDFKKIKSDFHKLFLKIKQLFSKKDLDENLDSQ